jgi:hypothetical protein
LSQPVRVLLHELIMADSGGSNGPKLRLWKWELRKLANDAELSITVCHLPPGTSKWNKIEHRLFSFISQNWRGKPLISYEVIVKLIAATTTTTGLRVRSAIDRHTYQPGMKVSDEQMASLRIASTSFTATGNYALLPRV